MIANNAKKLLLIANNAKVLMLANSAKTLGIANIAKKFLMIAKMQKNLDDCKCLQRSGVR